MSATKRSLIIALVGIGLTLIAAGLSPLLIAQAQEATPEPTPDATPIITEIYDLEPISEITGNNSYCLVCHSQPWQTVTLGDGTIQNLYVDPNTVHDSVHGAGNPQGELGCTDCHGQEAFPHNNPSPANSREYAIYAVSLCGRCHADKVAELENGLHERAILSGNTEAAVCTDCHGSHAVQPVVEQPELIAGVCGDCHDNTLDEWRVSAHNEIGPLGCATCHSPHSQQLRAGNDSNELCTNCHDNVEDRFIHGVHWGEDAADPVACVDCHMYTGEPDGSAVLISDTVSVFDLQTGHTMKMSATPCTTCHEDMVASGEWAQLMADRTVVVEMAPTNEPGAVASENELEAAVEESAQTSYVPLLQGLILGLGFGVTFAAVFIARGNRAAQSSKPDKSE